MKKGKPPIFLLAAFAFAVASCNQINTNHRFIPRTLNFREGELFRAATNIQRPSDFELFEPILEQITQQEPIRFNAVSFAQDREIAEVCQSHVRGCYNPRERRITLSQDLLDSGRGERVHNGICEVGRRRGISSSARILTWIHEQGHRYDNQLRENREGQWIDQVEAEAFVYYVAEIIAQRYDRNLGLSILDEKSEMYIIQPGSTREAIINRTNSSDFNPWEIELANTSIFALLSGSFSNFGEIWYFIHTHSEEEVAQRIRIDSRRPNQAKRKFDQIMESIHPTQREAGENFEIPISISLERALRRDSVFGTSIETRDFRMSRFDSGSGNMFWSISYQRNETIFRIRIDRENTRGVGVEIEDEQNQRIIRVPNIQINEAEIISFENSQENGICARNSRIVFTNGAQVMTMIRDSLENVANQFGQNRMSRIRDWIAIQMKEIFRE